MKHIFIKNNTERVGVPQQGSTLIITMMLFVAVSLSVALGLVVPVLHANRTAQDALQSKQSYFIAESGVEDVLYRFRSGKQVGTSETLVLGTAQTTTVINTLSLTEKELVSLGNAKNRNRRVAMSISQGEGVSFKYGLQAGRGGMYLNSGSIVGNVYSNGPITASASGSNSISGNATSATIASPTIDQSNTGVGTPPQEVRFGGSLDWATNYPTDIGQSFVVANAGSIRSVKLFLKKNGNGWMNDITVRLMTNVSGAPGATLASTTIAYTDIDTLYGSVMATFSSTPTLTPGTTYWIVLDTSATYGMYYTMGATAATYPHGEIKVGSVGSTWAVTTPPGLDAYFEIALGGQTGLISGVRGGGIGGDARAYAVNNSLIGGTNYCQSGSGNNKLCTATAPDPREGEWPVSDDTVTAWKDKAQSGTVTTGNVSIGGGQSVTMGPRKIVGNLTVSGGATVTLSGPVWVTGTITIDGGATVKLSSAYGASSDVLLAGGTISLSGGGKANGSGTSGSYILLVSLSAASNAITQDGGSGAVILVAQNGTISLTGGVHAKQVTGYAISVGGGSSITYESGMADLSFSSGPSGTWNIDSWKER